LLDDAAAGDWLGGFIRSPHPDRAAAEAIKKINPAEKVRFVLDMTLT
jgi:hypothetical protein